MKVCTRLSQTESKPGWERGAQNSTPSEELLVTDLRGELALFDDVAMERWTMLPWMAIYPRVYKQHK